METNVIKSLPTLRHWHPLHSTVRHAPFPPSGPGSRHETGAAGECAPPWDATVPFHANRSQTPIGEPPGTSSAATRSTAHSRSGRIADRLGAKQPVAPCIPLFARNRSGETILSRARRASGAMPKTKAQREGGWCWAYLLKPQPIFMAGLTPGIAIATAMVVAMIIKQFLAMPLAGKVVAGLCLMATPLCRHIMKAIHTHMTQRREHCSRVLARIACLGSQGCPCARLPQAAYP